MIDNESITIKKSTLLDCYVEYARKSRIFMRMLKEHNAQRSYFVNVINHLRINPNRGNGSCTGTANRYLNNIINLSFYWDETNEGVGRWLAMHRRWKYALSNPKEIESLYKIIKEKNA